MTLDEIYELIKNAQNEISYLKKYARNKIIREAKNEGMSDFWIQCEVAAWEVSLRSEDERRADEY